MVKYVLSFILGAAAGATCSYLYLKPRYEEDNAINAEKNRLFYEEKIKEYKATHPVSEDQTDISDETETEAPEDYPEAKRKADELAAKLNYNSLYNKEPLTSAETVKKEDMVYLISPDQYDSETFLERRNLTYYEADDVLVDDLSEEILDIENTIGLENVQEFGNNFEDDPYLMHIRNNAFGYVYEVSKDERSYAAVMGENG